LEEIFVMSYKFTSQARWAFVAVAAGAVLFFSTATSAQFSAFQIPGQAEAAANAAAALATKCPGLPTSAQLKTALSAVVAANKADPNNSGGLNLDMWGSVVNRKGEVCAVAFTGTDTYAQWPGSRVISAQKANTANAFSLPLLALSSANLFFPTQNGQSLFGLQLSNPVDTDVAYSGDSDNYGTDKDGMLGKKIGGINVFGGGLALYKATPAVPTATSGNLIGALGVSGDTSCADHVIAWKTRAALKLDNVPAGVGAASGTRTSSDNIVHDLAVSTTTIGGFSSTGGFGHPTCSTASTNAAAALVTSLPTGSHP
jgi:uncharacterized protein GlcG (DUF336 family)